MIIPYKTPGIPLSRHTSTIMSQTKLLGRMASHPASRVRLPFVNYGVPASVVFQEKLKHTKHSMFDALVKELQRQDLGARISVVKAIVSACILTGQNVLEWTDDKGNNVLHMAVLYDDLSRQ